MSADLPPEIEVAVRRAAQQAFEAGVRCKSGGSHAAAREQAVTYAVTTVAYSWITEHARPQAEATAAASREERASGTTAGVQDPHA